MIHYDEDDGRCLRCYANALVDDYLCAFHRQKVDEDAEDARLEAEVHARRPQFDADLLAEIGREYGLLGQVLAYEQIRGEGVAA